MDIEALERKAYDAFAAGDVETLYGMLAEDVLWVVPGTTQISGEYKGRDAVMGFFGKVFELTDGTLSITPKVFMRADGYAATLVEASGTRNGHHVTQPSIQYARYEGEQIVEYHELPFDMTAFEQFWA